MAKSEPNPDHETFLIQARGWLDDPDGRKEMLRSIAEGLLTNLQVEAQEGQDVGGSAADRAVSRQCRKQYKETAEMAIQVSKLLDKELEK